MNHTEILCVLNSKISDDIGIRKINNILDSCVKYRNDDNYEFECKYLSTNAIFCSSNFCNSYYKTARRFAKAFPTHHQTNHQPQPLDAPDPSALPHMCDY